MLKKLVMCINSPQFAIGNQALAQKLREKSKIEIQFVSYSKECTNYLESCGEKVTEIIYEFERMVLTKPNNHYLIKIEKKYRVNCNLLLLGDRNIRFFPRKKQEEFLIKHFLFWENFLKENRIEGMIGGTERLINEVPRAILTKNKIRHFLPRYPPIKNKFMLTQRHLGHWDNLNTYWRKNKNKKLTIKQKKNVQIFINNFKKKRKMASLISLKPKLSIKNINYAIKRFYINIIVEGWKNPYANLFHITREQTERAIRKHLTMNIYSTPDLNKEFIFYPLHMQYDAQILVRAPEFMDQVSLVETMSNFLPAGVKLYVKEHPNFVGGMTLSELKRIKKLPNVLLIDPKVNSHILISNAKAIITINSNAGWEALLYEKPVICLGEAYYDIVGLTHNLRDLGKLKDTISTAIENPIFNKQTQLRLINAVLSSIRPGSVVYQRGHLKQFLDETNLDNVSNGIIDELKRFNPRN